MRLLEITLYRGIALFSAICNSHYTVDCTNWNRTNMGHPVFELLCEKLKRQMSVFDSFFFEFFTFWTSSATFLDCFCSPLFRLAKAFAALNDLKEGTSETSGPMSSSKIKLSFPSVLDGLSITFIRDWGNWGWPVSELWLILTEAILLGLFPVIDAPKASQDLRADLTPDAISFKSSISYEKSQIF